MCQKRIAALQLLGMVQVDEIIDSLVLLSSYEVKNIIRELVDCSEISDADIEDVAECLAERVGKVLTEDTDEDDEEDDEEDVDDEEDEEETDESECDCSCCEPKFPLRITTSDEDEDPVDIEIPLSLLNMVLEKSNEKNCSFNEAFSQLLMAGLEGLENVYVQKDNVDKDPFGF